MIAVIPVKPFGVAKRRLAGRFSSRERSHLGKAVAAHTARTVEEAGLEAWIVTGSDDVERWAIGLGYAVVRETPGEGLDGAARAGTSAAAAHDRRWMVLHADLPAITRRDVLTVAGAGEWVIAPTHDGGTAALAGVGYGFPFAYGPGSCARHLARAPGMTVVTRPGLAYDLDEARDYDLVLSLEAGRWIGDIE